MIMFGKSGKTTHSSKALKGHVAGGSEFKVVQGSSPPGNTRSAPVKMNIVTNSPPPKNSNAKPIEVKNHKEQPSTGKLELFLLVLEKIISIFTQQPSYRNHSALSKC